MTTESKVAIGALSSGVPGLDVVLGGGVPEYSLNLVAGSLGTGKTTLVQQIVFANASPERQALVFTALGEPVLKMLRYQQQFSFFDLARIERAIRYVSLNDAILGNDLDALLGTIVREVESEAPGIVVIDSFRALGCARGAAGLPEADLHAFMQRLALALMSWQATTFLVGEYLEDEMLGNPVFTMADGVIWMQQVIEHNAVVRKMRVMKMRGQAPMPGLHTFRVTDDGLEVFPRMPVPMRSTGMAPSGERLSSGVARLDEMLHGGFLTGDSILVAGPAGTGKTLLATQFIAAGVAHGEHGVIAVFEEQPQRYLDRALRVGVDLQSMVASNDLRILYLRPLDLSVDETLHSIQILAQEVGARRVVIDSLSGFELAVTPSFREEFRESFYRMIGTLSTVGITVMMTVEVLESFMDLRFSPHAISFLVDDVVFERYVEIDGRLERVIAVMKMRGSNHSRELHRYDIDDHGIQIGKPLRGYRGILTGVPGKVKRRRPRPPRPGLSGVEVGVLTALTAMREATVEELAERGGIERRAVERALARLLDLDYAIRARERGRTVYRPAAQPLLR
jgi:circadian clock protein KaiC